AALLPPWPHPPALAAGPPRLDPAGLAVRHDAVRDLDAGVGPPGHRPGDAEIDIVGMGADHEHPLDVFFLQHRPTLASAGRHIALALPSRDNRRSEGGTVEGSSPFFPPVDVETQRKLVAFLEEQGVDPDDIADAIREDSLWEVTTDSLLATPDDLTIDDLAARAGLTSEQLGRVLRALGLSADSCSSEDVPIATAGAAMVKLFNNEEA